MSDDGASTILVTGSNRGIGLEWIRQCATRMDRVYATCRHPEGASELKALAAAHPETVRIVPLDVGDPASIETAYDLVANDLHAEGQEGLDVLINNAGINGGGSGDGFEDMEMETMMEVFRVNAAGPHAMAKAFADMLRAGGGEGPATLVNVTSQLGSIANTTGGGWHSYKASKAALNMLTRLQNAALSPDVVAVAMHPGWVQTDMGGSNARLTPKASVDGMRAVIADLGPDDGGRFLTHDGGELPW